MKEPVNAIRLTYCDAAATWIRIVFSEPSNMNALPDKNRNMKWVESLIDKLKRNEIIAAAPAVGTAFAGLFWAEPMPSGAWECHQFVMPRFRGWTAFRCARAMVDLFFRLMPKVNHLVGFTPVTYRAALVSAVKAGFVACGQMPNYYSLDGHLTDCVMMVKERDNG